MALYAFIIAHPVLHRLIVIVVNKTLYQSLASNSKAFIPLVSLDQI